MAMLSDSAGDGPQAFRTQEGIEAAIRQACEEHADLAAFHTLGESEEGRPLYGVVLGRGRQAVSLIAGAHADEPVGPETLRTFLLEGLRQRARMEALFEHFRFVVVPHINPDGEARNRAWIERWPDLEAYLAGVVREPPGRDLEFGFPRMRPENRLVSEFLSAYAPFALHMSLHGMAFSEGALLLIERHWSFRTRGLQDGFAEAARAAGLPLHDHNRKGEKGFFYLAPGFNTTPEGEAMRCYFEAFGDEAMAARFHSSSMEWVRSLGGDPLCLVTELPLFLLPPSEAAPGVPATYLAFKERLPELKLRCRQGEPVPEALGPFDPRPLDLATAVRLQLRTVELGLQAVRSQLMGKG